MTDATTTKRRRSPFFRREKDGSVRIRLKLNGHEATMIEEAAGDEDVIEWLYRTFKEAAVREVEQARRQRPIAPPKEQA